MVVLIILSLYIRILLFLTPLLFRYVGCKGSKSAVDVVSCFVTYSFVFVTSAKRTHENSCKFKDMGASSAAFPRQVQSLNWK